MFISHVDGLAVYAMCDTVVFVSFDDDEMNDRFAGYYALEIPEEKLEKLYTRESTGYAQYKHIIHNRWIVYHDYGLDWAHSDKTFVKVKGSVVMFIPLFT